MEYMKIEEAATRFGLSVRRVQDLCKMGKISGAKRFGTNWMIPNDATRPLDGRSKAAKSSQNSVITKQPLIRKTPFLNMTNLYNTPGSADATIESLRDFPEAKELFSAETAYHRVDIDSVYEKANYFLQINSGFYAIISGGMLLASVAMWKGDVELWNKAKRHLYEAPCATEHEREIVSLSIAVANLSIRDTTDFPDWFTKGRFEYLPPDSQPSARVYYCKYLLIRSQEVAAGKHSTNEGSGRSMIRFIPYIMEPMIAKAVAEKIILEEIYLRILCAIAYHQIGDEENAVFHLDRAIALCLPDKLYEPLIEYRRQLNLFLDERLMLVDPEAAKTVKKLHKKLYENWTKLHNAVLNNSIASALSAREREVVRLAAFGMSNQEIADQLHLTVASVKSIIQIARNKTGIKDRSEFGAYI